MLLHKKELPYYTKIKDVLFREKEYILISAVFFSFFLLLTPLGVFSNHIPKQIDEGFFSIVRFDISGDDGARYVPLRSIFFDHDIGFINEPFTKMGGINDKTGYFNSFWPIGSSILWFPFFIVGHIFALLMKSLGLDISIDGYSFPYITMISIGSTCYGYLGTLFCYKSLCDSFGKKISFITTISALFSSTLLYWFYIRFFMDVVLDFFQLAFYIYLFQIYMKKTPQKKIFYLYFGIVGGLLSITRFNGIIYLSSLALYLLVTIIKKVRQKETDRIISITKDFGFFFLGFCFAISPQLITQKVLYGSFFDFGPSLGGPSFHSIELSDYIYNFMDIFFGKRGLFLQCPIYFIGLLGFLLVFSGRYKDSGGMKLFYSSLLVSFILQVLLVARLTNNFGNAYGIKYLAPSILIFVFGIANILKHLKVGHIIYYWILGFFLISWQYIQIIQYKIVVPLNKFSVFDVPQDFFMKIIDHNPALLLRSSNFIKLIINGYLHLDSLVNFYFIIIIPLILISVMSFTIFFRKFVFRFCKYRVILIIYFVLIIGLNILLLAHPRIDQKEINKRSMWYNELPSIHERLLVRIENRLLYYRLGLKKKDRDYLNLILQKTQVLFLRP